MNKTIKEVSARIVKNMKLDEKGYLIAIGNYYNEYVIVYDDNTIDRIDFETYKNLIEKQ